MFKTGKSVGALTVLISLVLAIPYSIHNPIFSPSGDTFLGLFLGVVAGLMVLQLMFLGIKKRFWIDLLGNQKNWVDAHNYTGLALLLIALLHAGFQIDGNIHGFTMVLLMFLIATGLFGTIAYRYFPSMRNKLLAFIDLSRAQEDLIRLDSELLASSAKISSRLNHQTWEMLQNYFEDISVSPIKYARTMLNRKANDMVFLLQELSDQEQGYRAANSDELSTYKGLLAKRKAGIHKLRIARCLDGSIQLWRSIHKYISVVFFVCLVVHVIVSFQY